jgi:hypothetical protein
MNYKQPVKQVSASTNVPSPVKGLDSFDPITAMDPVQALILRNWFPQAYGCSVRKGFREQQTLAGVNPIESLLVWNSEVDNPATIGVEQALFAAEGGKIWNISATGQAPVLLLGSLGIALDTNRWQSVNVAQAATSYLYCVNGVSNPVVITGPATFQRLVAGNGTTPWTIKGVDPSTFIGCGAYNKSIWFIQKNSSIAWYLPPATLWGDILPFDFGPYMTRGGFIVSINVWSNDDANTAHEHRIVAITSGGEALVFAGDDPADFTTWSNLGVYYISSPIGRRCAVKLGADLVVLTQQGLVSLATVSKNITEDLFQDGNGKMVQFILTENIANYGTLFGWELQVFSRANQLILNMPQGTPTLNKQLVLNTVTGAWCAFENQPAFCWAIYQSQPMFALMSTIYEAWVGYQDNVGADGTGGEAIVATVQQAYSYFDARAQNKHFKFIRPTFVADAPVSYAAGIDIDFAFNDIFGISSAPPDPGKALWDVALWDRGALWGAALRADSKWISAVGMGYAASIKMITQTTAETLWVSTDWVYETGGII